MQPRSRRRATLFARHFKLLFKSWFLLVIVRATLSIKGHAPALRWIRNATKRPNMDLPASLIVWAVEFSAKFVPNATCLTRSLALRYLLEQAGLSAEIQIGVKNDEEGAFKAHAWVTLDGEILTGDTPEEIAAYKPLVAL